MHDKNLFAAILSAIIYLHFLFGNTRAESGKPVAETLNR